MYTMLDLYVTWSREMSHLSKISISIFLHHCLTTLKCFILMQTPIQLDIWLQSYAGFDNAKNNIKQRNLNPVFANISITTSPTSDSFLLIMSHMGFEKYLWIHIYINHTFYTPHMCHIILWAVSSMHTHDTLVIAVYFTLWFFCFN